MPQARPRTIRALAVPAALRLFKTISFLRVLFGFYNEDLLKRGCSRWLCKLYCMFYVSLIIKGTIDSREMNDSYLASLGMFEMSAYGLFSLFWNGCPLSYVYSVMSRCKTRESKRLFLKAIMYPLCLIISVDLVSMTFYSTACRLLGLKCSFGTPDIFVFGIGWITMEFGKMSKLMSLSLLYCEMRTLQAFIRKKGFRSNVSSASSQPDYVDMYESICDSFQKVETSIKLMIMVNIIFLIPIIMTALYEGVADIEQRSISPGAVRNLVSCSSVFLNVLAPLFLFELIAETEENIIGYVIDLQVASSDMRTRSKMRRLIQYMRSRRLRFTLWHITPIDVRLAVGLASFSFTYIIAILQLTHAIN